jgi:peptide/nickel transport system permease protein
MSVQNKKHKSSLAKRNIHKFMSNKLAIVGLFILLFFTLLAIFAPLISSYDPSYVSPADRLKPMSSEHLLGTDNAGRDTFTRLLYGGRISIAVGLSAALGSAIIGCILGCIAGYYGGRIDSFIIYVCEIFTTFPQIMLVLILVGLAGRSLTNLVLIFCFTGWMGTTRLVRSRVLSLKTEPFVESCVANGISGASIMFNHILPNTLGPVIVAITMQTAGFVLAEAALSFLGMGVPTSIPTWGNVINAASSFHIFQNYPVLWIAPGIVISLFVLGVNFFGDGLRDVFDATQ